MPCKQPATSSTLVLSTNRYHKPSTAQADAEDLSKMRSHTEVKPRGAHYKWVAAGLGSDLGISGDSKSLQRGSIPRQPAESAWQWCLTGPENRRDVMSVRSSILPLSSSSAPSFIGRTAPFQGAKASSTLAGATTCSSRRLRTAAPQAANTGSNPVQVTSWPRSSFGSERSATNGEAGGSNPLGAATAVSAGRTRAS